MSGKYEQLGSNMKCMCECEDTFMNYVIQKGVKLQKQRAPAGGAGAGVGRTAFGSLVLIGMEKLASP